MKFTRIIHDVDHLLLRSGARAGDHPEGGVAAPGTLHVLLPVDALRSHLQIDACHPEGELPQKSLLEGHVEFRSILRKHFGHGVEDDLAADGGEVSQHRVALVVVNRIVSLRPD